MGSLALDQTQAHRAQRSPTYRAIDLAFLARQTMGNKALESDILQLYRCQLKKFEADWSTAQAHPNFSIELHAMRSAALGVGAKMIAELSKSVELALADGQASTEALYAQLGTAVRDTLSFIDDILAE